MVPFSVVVVFLTLILLFQGVIFKIEKIQVVGVKHSEYKGIANIVQKHKGNILSLDKKEVSKEILAQYPMISQIYITPKLLHTVIIGIKEFSIVGKVKNGYVTEKAKVITQKISLKGLKVPFFQVKNNSDLYKVRSLIEDLDILKKTKPQFFNTILKIDLLNIKENDIFILLKDKKYSFNKVPNLTDLLKIQFLETKQIHGRNFTLKGNTLVIN